MGRRPPPPLNYYFNIYSLAIELFLNQLLILFHE